MTKEKRRRVITGGKKHEAKELSCSYSLSGEGEERNEGEVKAAAANMKEERAEFIKQ